MDADTAHQPCFIEISRIQAERDRALHALRESEALAFNLREALGVLLSKARTIQGVKLAHDRADGAEQRIDLSKEIDLAKKAMAGEELVP